MIRWLLWGDEYIDRFSYFWSWNLSLVSIPDQSKNSIRLKWNSLYSVCCEFWKRGMYLHQLATNASGLIEIPNLLTQAIPGCLKRWVDSRKEQPVPGDGWGRCLQPREGLSPLMHSHTLIVGQSCHFGPKQIPPTWLSSKKAGLNQTKGTKVLRFVPILENQPCLCWMRYVWPSDSTEGPGLKTAKLLSCFTPFRIFWPNILIPICRLLLKLPRPIH